MPASSASLAVRSAHDDAWGATQPYTLLGPAEFVSAAGERPIAIAWRLRHPVPADLYESFKLAAASAPNTVSSEH